MQEFSRRAAQPTESGTTASGFASLRAPSPLGGRRPTKDDLAAVDRSEPDTPLDLMPPPGVPIRLLIVGVNPGIWTAAVNAPFARPGNRFWPALAEAGITDYVVDASAGLSVEDEEHMVMRGYAITNLVGRPTVRADELTPDELRRGAERIAHLAWELRPAAVAVAGITAYRTAFQQPKAKLGKQDASTLERAPGVPMEWPEEVALWAVPQPSGLNAHENVASLAEKWRAVLADIEHRSRDGQHSPGA